MDAERGSRDDSRPVKAHGDHLLPRVRPLRPLARRQAFEHQLAQAPLGEAVVERGHAQPPLEQVQLSLGQLQFGRRRPAGLAKALDGEVDPVGHELELEREVVRLVRVRGLDVQLQEGGSVGSGG